MISFFRIIKTFPKIFFVIKNILFQKNYIQKKITPLLLPFFKNADSSLSSKDFKKFKTVYGLLVPSILGELLYKFSDIKMNEKVRLNSTIQAGLTGIVDDFFDEQDKTSQEVIQLLKYKREPISSAEALCQNLFNQTISTFSNKDLLWSAIEKTLQAQEDSKRQIIANNNPLTDDELFEVTIRKGGDAFLFYVLLYCDQLTKNEEAFFYLLGGLTQLGNDIFDLYKDAQEGIETLMTRCKDVREIQTTFIELLQQIYSLHDQMKEKEYHQFLEYYSIGVFNRCWICLEQYRMLQERDKTSLFDYQNYDRSELICDMEKPANLLRSLTMDIKKEINFH